MKTYTLNELLLESQPGQFLLLDKLLSLFRQSPYLSQVFVRGSIAKNSFDRVSDIDMVLSFDAKAYRDVIETLDTLLSHNFHVLFPGWCDAIVADFGGLGFVFLIEYEGKLYQADIYLIPSSRAEKLPSLAKTKLLYSREQPASDTSVDILAAEQFISDFRASTRGPEHLLTEVVVVASLIQKRIKRSQVFLNYSETHMLNSGIRSFLRAVFEPEFVEYGWYHIEENFSRLPERKAWLCFLWDLVKGPSTHDAASLKAVMNRFLEMVRAVTPDLYARHEDALNLFFKQSDFS